MEMIIDRFEGEYAVVELPDGIKANLPVILVPGAKEGDVIRIIIDGDATEGRKQRIEELAKRLWIN